MSYVILLLSLIFLLIWILIKAKDSFSNIKRKIEQNQTKKNIIKQKYGDRFVNYNLTIELRNRDIIESHLKKLKYDVQKYYYIDNSVRDCIDDIAHAENRSDMAPGHEYLSNWIKRANAEYIKLSNDLKTEFQLHYNNMKTIIEEKKVENIKHSLNKLIETHQNIISQFLQIAERKVSIIDDWGDERWDELPKQIEIIILKIASKEGYQNSQIQNWQKHPLNMPQEFKLLKDKLESDFKIYHSQRQNDNKKQDLETISNMSGIEFEIYLSNRLKKLGFEVAGTPTTGDQGADIIAKKDKKTYIIQAKRYSGSVGNKAVQEVAAAVQFYQGDIGCVITNSKFTPAAKALAQKNNVILIDGNNIDSINDLL